LIKVGMNFSLQNNHICTSIWTTF